MKRLLAVVLAGVLSACTGLPFNAQAPRVSVADVEIKSLGLLEQQLDLGLRVANPNDFDLVIEALDFELELNGRPFATGLSRVSTRVPAASMRVLRVDAIMQSKNLIRQIRTLPSEMLKAGVPYRIKGRVKLDRVSDWLPFDHAGVYGGEPKPPKGRAL
ncbi:MAG TPA: LEA type 2 family protein [Thiobacillus sp.]|nr:LEA type 2 family protein [Thiobacillus sp.]